MSETILQSFIFALNHFPDCIAKLVIIFEMYKFLMLNKLNEMLKIKTPYPHGLGVYL